MGFSFFHLADWKAREKNLAINLACKSPDVGVQILTFGTPHFRYTFSVCAKDEF